jgi:hypothetical protein
MDHIAHMSYIGPWLKTFPIIMNFIPFCGPNLHGFNPLNFCTMSGKFHTHLNMKFYGSVVLDIYKNFKDFPTNTLNSLFWLLDTASPSTFSILIYLSLHLDYVRKLSWKFEVFWLSGSRVDFSFIHVYTWDIVFFIAAPPHPREP